MDGGGVVFAAELMGYFRKAHVQFGSKHVHGDLTRDHDVLVAFGAQNVFHRHMEVFGGAFDNVAGGQVFGPVPTAIEHSSNYLDVGLDTAHFAESQYLVERALELADVAL